MKKIALALLTVFASASVLAVTPASYDSKFNVSANVPEGAFISDPNGKPVTDVDIELTVNPLTDKMDAMSPELALWNNDKSKLEVSLIMEDAIVPKDKEFRLTSTQNNQLKRMHYNISTITASGVPQEFLKSGDSKDFTLTANGEVASMPIVFKFESNEKYTTLGQGHYTGVVYANVSVKP